MIKLSFIVAKIEANANRYTFVWKKSIQNHESKMNEDSKALYHELVTNKIIPEIKEDHDNELTKEEIDLIGSHLDKEIEDLNQHINNEKCTKTRKQIRLKRTKIKNAKSKSMIILSESIDTNFKNLF